MTVLRMGSHEYQAGGREHLLEQLRGVEQHSWARIKLVAACEQGEVWALQYGEVVVSPEPMLGPGTDLDFGSMVVVSECLAVADFIARFEQAVDTGRFTCGRVTVAVAKIFESWGIHRLPSDNPHCRWPCVIGDGARDRRVSWTGPFITTVADKMLCFGDVLEIVEYITTFSALSRVENILCTLWVVIEDHRARITGVERDGDVLIVRTEGRSLDGRVLAARIREPNGVVTRSSLPVQQEMKQQLPSGPSEILLTIVDETLDVLDMRRGHLPVPPVDYEGVQSATDLIQVVAGLLRDGENAKCEYKPWVELSLSSSESKLREVIATVVAMGNVDGGYVVVGVDDHGIVLPPMGKASRRVLGPYLEQVKQAEAEAQPLLGEKELLLEAVKLYGRKLRDEVQKIVVPSLDLNPELVVLPAGPVLLLEVRVGRDRPYQVGDRREFYVRRNATNQRATAEDLRPLFQPLLEPPKGVSQ